MTAASAPLPPSSLVEPEEVDTTRTPRKMSRAEARAAAVKGKLTSPWTSLIAILIAIVWTVPTFGLLITSFRPRSEIRTSGWWTLPWNFELTLENYQEALFGSSTRRSSTPLASPRGCPARTPARPPSRASSPRRGRR